VARPVIALLTDFGLRDHYVGVMKGVALGICPEATLVDISHDVPAHDIVAGALELAAAYRYFPAGTVFLAVIDPGVGSSRRAVAVELGEYRFVAPDNGVVSIVFDETPRERVGRIVELAEPRYARTVVSRTFEGRDRFAPAAAWLAAGVDLAALGPALETVERVRVRQPSETGDGIEGEVVRVDRFGNLITNIDHPRFQRVSSQGPVMIQVGERRLSGVVSTYEEAEPGGLCALFSSSDHLEIAVAGGSAAAELAAGRGTLVRVTGRGWSHFVSM
jgi:S-adenosylmethionine hydrolase